MDEVNDIDHDRNFAILQVKSSSGHISSMEQAYMAILRQNNNNGKENTWILELCLLIGVFYRKLCVLSPDTFATVSFIARSTVALTFFVFTANLAHNMVVDLEKLEHEIVGHPVDDTVLQFLSSYASSVGDYLGYVSFLPLRFSLTCSNICQLL